MFGLMIKGNRGKGENEGITLVHYDQSDKRMNTNDGFLLAFKSNCQILLDLFGYARVRVTDSAHRCLQLLSSDLWNIW